VLASDAWHALLIFGSAFVLEDIAVLGAALLVVNSMVSLPWAVGSSFAGIWLGDLGLYLLALHFGRPIFEKPWFNRFVGKKIDLSKSEAWFHDHGTIAIVMSRLVPGTRLPTYLTAGLLKIPAGRFIAVTAAACVVWVAALFWLSFHIGMMVIEEFAMFRTEAGKLGAIVVLAGGSGWLLRKVLRKIPIRSLRTRVRRMFLWEFWPPAIFYVPVAFKVLLLAIRYRSLTLPTMANPGMQTGGLIGETKFETLADIMRAHPDFVAETHRVPFVSVEQQGSEICGVRSEFGLPYPLVLKPDVAQRGHGFRVIRSDKEAYDYAAVFQRDVLVQKYIEGPEECGIFYYRYPHKSHGRIFAITEKSFPTVTGDGRHTLEELILRDLRASLVAGTYLKRFAAQRNRVLKAGECMKLVEAGNHCQGAIFLNGARFYSPELEQRIDEISRSIPGFFIGRYDVRYESEQVLREGRAFRIVELNGISSEATSIYDPANPLWSAYRTLFRQWEIIFAIAAENRSLGLTPTTFREIWENWRNYQRRLKSLPVSD
jgi:membrane protein DedA with SNARE-associated domain